MKNKGRNHIILSVGLLLSIATANSQAAVIINASEVSGDVVVTASGALDLTGLQRFSSTSSSGGLIWPAGGYVIVGRTIGILDLYRNHTGPIAFGAGAITYAASNSGGVFGLSNNGQWLLLPPTFTSGSTVDSSSVFSGQTLASMGMEPGIYTWSWSSDSITLNVPVPETGACGLLLAGLGIIGSLARRRKR